MNVKADNTGQIESSSQRHSHDLDFWEKRAPSFSDHAKKTHYPNEFIKLIAPQPDWTVFDMACGGGTLAIPLAHRVRRVTAVDFSPSMIDIVKRACAERDITNVDALLGEWDGDWDALGIGTYDIAIASRSLRADNSAPYIKKLMGAARRKVFISAPVGSGPMDMRMLGFAGRETSIKSDYRQFLDVFETMGIKANVDFIEENHNNCWPSVQDAVKDNLWMFFGITPEEEERLQLYMKENLIPTDDGVALNYERICRWAVMWWEL
jgi:SAM-dependent methyltransferase